LTKAFFLSIYQAQGISPHHSLDNNLTSFFGAQAVRKLNDAKKLESSAPYSADFGKE